MRLWHEALIPYLPRQQLLGLHREVCALRGNGWGKKHSTVDYVFRHPYGWLVAYHFRIMKEMENRGYEPDISWYYCFYRGKSHEGLNDENLLKAKRELIKINSKSIIYPEHNDRYLRECLENLAQKGIVIEMEE